MLLLLFPPLFLFLFSFFFLFLVFFSFFISLFISVCPGSGTLNATSGTLQSPGYPSLYPGNIRCSWKIVAPSGYVIKLAIKEIDLDNCYSCSCDAVRVYDGVKQYDTSLGKVCGHTRHTVLSSDRFMYVTFSTNIFKGGHGFKAFYSAMLKSEGKITKLRFL